MRKLDLTGQTFHYLTVIDLHYVCYRSFWRCRCKCGNEVVVNANGLRSGNTKSCGCYNKEQIKKANTKHKDCGTKLYWIWGGIINRTTNVNNKRHKYYKNISVVDDWRDYRKFKEWALRSGYKDGLQIDRIDTSKDYCPENCQWLDSAAHCTKTNAERWRRYRLNLAA